MSVRLGQVLGLELAGAAVALPVDVAPRAPTASLAGRDVARHLFGAGWREELARRGRGEEDLESPRGVRRRGWLYDPVARRWCADQVALAIHAAEQALARARVAADQVDQIVVATSTSDRVTASTSARVARGLGVRAAALDVRAGGAAGIEAWILASQRVAHGARTALVVAVETPSAYLDPQDLGAALLYGDAAAALVIRGGADRARGIEAAIAGTEELAGRSSTAPGSLPPDPQAPHAGYRFQRPDAHYLQALSAVWADVGRRLRGECGGSAPLLVAGCATHEQRDAVAAGFGVEPGAVVAGLEQVGFSGCAAALVGVVELGKRSMPERFAVAAVGGGVHWSGLVWVAGRSGPPARQGGVQ